MGVGTPNADLYMHKNPVKDNLKTCRLDHSYDANLRGCPECRRILTRRYDKRRYAAGKTFIENLKRGKACSICGFADYRALHFHHRDPSEKDFNISDWVRRRTMQQSEILKEVEKCDLVCANCHALIHYEQ